MRKQIFVSWHIRAKELLSTIERKRDVARILNEEGYKTNTGSEISYNSINQLVQSERIKNSPYNIPGASAHSAGIRSAFNEDRN